MESNREKVDAKKALAEQKKQAREAVRKEKRQRWQEASARSKEERHERIPYILVAGEREAEAGQIGVRNRREGELGAMSVAQLVEKMQKEVANKTI